MRCDCARRMTRARRCSESKSACTCRRSTARLTQPQAAIASGLQSAERAVRGGRPPSRCHYGGARRLARMVRVRACARRWGFGACDVQRSVHGGAHGVGLTRLDDEEDFVVALPLVHLLERVGDVVTAYLLRILSTLSMPPTLNWQRAPLHRRRAGKGIAQSRRRTWNLRNSLPP